MVERSSNNKSIHFLVEEEVKMFVWKNAWSIAWKETGKKIPVYIWSNVLKGMIHINDTFIATENLEKHFKNYFNHEKYNQRSSE